MNINYIHTSCVCVPTAIPKKVRENKHTKKDTEEEIGSSEHRTSEAQKSATLIHQPISALYTHKFSHDVVAHVT